MSLALLVYLIDISGTFKFLSLITCILSLGILGIWLIIQCDMGEFHSKSIKWLAGIAIASLLMGVLIPREKTSYLMVAAHLAQKVYESPESAKIQSKILVIVNKKLDKFIDEKE